MSFIQYALNIEKITGFSINFAVIPKKIGGWEFFLLF